MPYTDNQEVNEMDQTLVKRELCILPLLLGVPFSNRCDDRYLAYASTGVDKRFEMSSAGCDSVQCWALPTLGPAALSKLRVSWQGT